MIHQAIGGLDRWPSDSTMLSEQNSAYRLTESSLKGYLIVIVTL